MPMAMGSPPPGGDYDRASQVHAFTWTLAVFSLVFVAGRMYSRLKLTRNVWWDDWCVCIAVVLDLVISVTWSVYAGRGYARHLYYLTPQQLSNALELNTISRTLCIISIAIGKISVAFLIERIAGPSDWRKWMLRCISISVAISALITVLLFYIQCRPIAATWDKAMLKDGTGKCWDPIPVNTWNLVIASYWAFLDFALAFIPLDIVWKLDLSRQKKLLLSLLLSMGVFAGICAAVKTSKVPISVHAKTDITWATIELLMWNGIEMNVIIIAACIPTLRPLCIILFNRPGASHYRRPFKHRQSSYQKTPDSSDATDTNLSSGTASTKAFEKKTNVSSTGGTKSMYKQNSSTADDVIHVNTREVGGQNDDIEEAEWGNAKDLGVPLSELPR